jgi:exopolyphosphatase/guanosine-5'-triphosphate,3'-diphosphate pyrophosphatase
VSHIRHNYHAEFWSECVGSSGTLNAIEGILVNNGWSEGGITRKGLAKLESKLLKFKHMDKIKLEGLREQRRSVIVAGVAITCALFDELGVEHMRTSKGALREGVIYDLMGRLSHEDVRERTVNALMQRYSVDLDTADIVARRARILFNATRSGWQLERNDKDVLIRVARTHELGMAISHKHFNRHSAYLLQNADLPGFSQEEQEHLALLAQGHRGKLDKSLFRDISEGDQPRLKRLLCITRLAALFKYVEKLEHLPEFTVHAREQQLTLGFPEQWLAAHPLTARELEQEQVQLTKIGIELLIA